MVSKLTGFCSLKLVSRLEDTDSNDQWAAKTGQGFMRISV